MKKLSLTVLLIVAMMLSLTGCGKTDYQLYKDALENATEAKYADVSGEAKITLALGDSMSMSIPVNFDVKYDLSDENAPKMLVTYSMSLMGVDTKVSMYMADGYTYTATTSKKGTFEQTTKVKAENSDFSLDADIDVQLELFTEKDFDDIKKENVDNGVKYTITKSAEQMNEFAANAINAVLEAMQDTSEEEKNIAEEGMEELFNSLTLGELTMQFVIKDGQFTSYAAVMKNIGIVVDDEAEDEDDEFGFGAMFGGSVNLDIEFSMDVNSIGEKLDVAPPYSLDEYEEEQDDFVPDFDF